MATTNGSEFSEPWKRNWEDHDRIWKTLASITERMDALAKREDGLARDHEMMHTHLQDQKKNIDNLLDGLRKLIDRIPPERLG